jgi:hypothetical protein
MKKRTYDRERLTPAVKCSICTGEKAAGFLDKSTGRFTEVLLIRSDGDLARFMKQYGITEPPETIY